MKYIKKFENFKMPFNGITDNLRHLVSLIEKDDKEEIKAFMEEWKEKLKKYLSHYSGFISDKSSSEDIDKSIKQAMINAVGPNIKNDFCSEEEKKKIFNLIEELFK